MQLVILIWKISIQNTKNKFEPACFLGIEELPLTKYSKILQLQKHGVAIKNSYQNTILSGVFIDCITESLANELKIVPEKCNFFNVLVDRLTNWSMNENEALLAMYFDPCLSFK